MAGKLDFAKPAHLLNVVREGGGNEVASVVRQKLADPALSTARKLVLAELLAQIGNSADAALALELASIHPTILHALVNAARERNLQAPANAAELLNVPLKINATTRAERSN